ncbi:MAG: GNAT family N-acetyltransferase, partial [Chloroflexota bacterium]|nr:GNAT family N-acetyltransferase [Chloroflexota bacterium]
LDPQLEMVFASIIEGNTVGELWVTGSQTARCRALLWDQGNNVFYLYGEDLDDAVLQSMTDLINGEIRDESIRKEQAYFKVHTLSDNVEAYLQKIFTGIQLTHYRKSFYAFKSSRSNQVIDPGIKCANIEIIDQDFLQRTALRGLPSILEEILCMWPSPERFFEFGFGTAVVFEGQIIGWCMAEYLSKQMCGIGIMTHKPHENKGVASAMAARFVDHALELGIKPNWETNRGNKPSIRVAEKVGFEYVQERTFWWGRFDEVLK